MDSMGDVDGRRRDDLACSNRICASFTREGEQRVCVQYLTGAYSGVVLQREDELERRRASHHINFDAL